MYLYGHSAVVAGIVGVRAILHKYGKKNHDQQTGHNNDQMRQVKSEQYG
jgi:hypothetical protein